MSVDLDLLGGAYLLRALGFMGASFDGDLQQLAANPDLLAKLQDTFGLCAGDMGHGGSLASMLQQGGIPSSMTMPPPNMQNCQCPNQYAMPQMPFGMGMSGQFNLKELFG